MNFIGPVLPPSKDDTNEIEDVYGPQLPPKRLDVPNGSSADTDKTERIVGPVLPPGFLPNTFDDSDNESDDSDDLIGPQLPSSSESNTDDICKDIEKRAAKMKQKLTNAPDTSQPKREEWMTVLPPEISKNFGLGARSFMRQTPQKTGDRSGWTETPSTSTEDGGGKESKTKRMEDEERMKRKMRDGYDEEMSKIAHKHHKKSKRKESLLEMHTKDRKRGKGKESKGQERIPFDRDKDLRLNIMDSAKRAALVKNSKLLNTNFSHGEGKYL